MDRFRSGGLRFQNMLGRGLEGVGNFGIITLGNVLGKTIYSLTPLGPIHTLVGAIGGVVIGNMDIRNTNVRLLGYSTFSSLAVEGFDFLFDGFRHWAENVIYDTIRTPDEAARDWIEQHFPETVENRTPARGSSSTESGEDLLA